MSVQGLEIKSSKVEKPLGVHIDDKLIFKTHINTLCKKAGQKLSVLASIIPYISQAKSNPLMPKFLIL